MDKNSRTELLSKGEIRRALKTLVLPAVMAMLSTAIYNVVDTAFIGLLDDTASIGAAAVLFPVFLLVGAIGLTFGTGAGSIISRKLGAGKYQSAKQTASTAFYTSLIAGIIFAIIVNIFITQILRFFGASESILERAVIYGRIIIGGSFFQIVKMCMNNLLRSEGASAYSGKAMILGAGLNIILDPIFMFVFNWGLAGAAIATITAQAASALFMFRFFAAKKGILSLAPSFFYPKF